MNNGKICVSICAETAGELIEKINLAQEFADVIELRFDCLKEAHMNIALDGFLNFNTEKIFLVTFRPSEQGGKRNLTLRERLNFWQVLFSKNLPKNLYVDIELDSAHLLNLKTTKSIASLHYFSDVPEKLDGVYSLFSISRPENKPTVWKLAVQTKDVVDSIEIWNFLKKAKHNSQEIIPIAMGEAGKWTRILGLAHGAFMTYASLDAGNETAPGQVSAGDLIETYRAKELNEETEIYGIMGNPVSQSVSPYMHNAAFRFHNLNAVYLPFEVNDLDAFITRMVKPDTREIDLNFKGFSVTIPHKKSIIKHLDFIDQTAEKIGAVNTVKIRDGKFHGYNTDANGFIEPLRQAYGSLKNTNIAILGAGGSARAAIYALKNEGANVTIFARDLDKAKNLAKEFEIDLKEFPTASDESQFGDYDILVNTTPLGMKGKFETETPVVASQLENVKLVYDLVYNPFETCLINEARKAGVPTIGGLAMLVAQGIEQFKIWTGKDAPMKEMGAAAIKRLK